MKTAIVVGVEPELKPLGLGGNFENNVRTVSELGYDGIELFMADPERANGPAIKELTSSYQLDISAIGTGPTYVKYGWSFSSSDAVKRRRSVERIKEYIRLADNLDCHVILGSVKGWSEEKENQTPAWVKGCLKECSTSAQEHGVTLLLEPINRYESNLVNTLEEALQLILEVGSESMRILADTFHMNIEESSLEDALRDARRYLAYMHFSDSNRMAPGLGHIDFRAIMSVLKEIGYDRYVSAEILPGENQNETAEKTIRYLETLGT